ncbi:MAG: Rieske (2Fe-2S) protein [Rhodovulum sulfidophilum]|uniref:Rieske (2Fe-2S) protein n=1 Tax=Rhodovulum sulfidophilum TaxID=35806 RepID=A0A2W5N2N8_RHOSU|nr:MAG: Rieske (2Fe-2S) protein [Rhodovulum sulfidophilum]
MTVRNDMLARLGARKPGFSLDREFYRDEGFFQLDLEQIWYRDWLFAGHDCEMPAPGSFITLTVGEYPVLLVRDRAGAIRAFHNVCRHRGSRVCLAEKGRTARLVCPYHQWTYDLDGQLLFARQMGEDFDPKPFGLRPVACETVAGYVFVSLADSPEDFAPMRARLTPYLAPHRLTEAKVAFESTIVEKGNWKLVWENNRECYHCAANHPELCKTYPEDPSITGVGGMDEDPEIQELWAECADRGLTSSFDITADGQSRVVRVPLLREAESYTMSGRRAVARELSDDVPGGGIGALLLFHYPTTWNHVLIDHAVTFRVMPLTPLTTAVTTKWLVHKDAVEGVDYDLETLTHVWTETNDQDRRIVEDNAAGIASPAYTPGPYSPVHEDGVMQFVDWYARTIEDRLRGSERRPALRSVG